MNIEQVTNEAPSNIKIFESLLTANNKIESCNKALVAISGGSDSDILIDLIHKVDYDKKAKYVFFYTGLEYDATKRHLRELEQRYGVTIETIKAIKPIPLCCRQYGLPFLSKQVSEYISRLQAHNFQWEDEPLDQLLTKYPKCKVALRWWCNDWGEKSRFNISWNKHLKDFLIQYPPDFKISNKCCDYAKKKPVKQYLKEHDFDLNITGVRKAEGGARASAYKNCFTQATDSSPAQYRPLFWYDEEAKRAYEEHYAISHSDCYEIWGLPRTGCAGCPYALNFENELEAVREYEPKLYMALNKVFGKAYEYTRKYRDFVRKMDGGNNG